MNLKEIERVGKLVLRVTREARAWQGIAEHNADRLTACENELSATKESLQAMTGAHLDVAQKLAVSKSDTARIAAALDCGEGLPLIEGAIASLQAQVINYKALCLHNVKLALLAMEERDQLQVERDALRAQLDAERAPKPVDVPRAHPVKVGEYVKNDNGDVCQVHEVYAEEYLLNTGWTWAFENCTPCDPPTASHDTPAGKETAQAAAEPKPGDVVRLVRVPTNDEYPHDSGRWEPNWGGIGDCMGVDYVGSNINGTRVVRAVFGLEWPLSCVEVVKGGDK
jgi:hypothetical protein